MAKFMQASPSTYNKSVEIKRSTSKKKLESKQSLDNVQKIPMSINKRNIGFPKDMNPLNMKIIPKAQLYLEKKPPKGRVILKQSSYKQKMSDKNCQRKMI
jgi:hypothetical protein